MKVLLKKKTILISLIFGFEVFIFFLGRWSNSCWVTVSVPPQQYNNNDETPHVPGLKYGGFNKHAYIFHFV